MKDVVEPLLKWYEINKRDLPWRKDKNPYHVWISEIMLQQTRIEAVKEYYARFIKQIPNIQSLSEISEDELLKLWEGLGYYTRARNLKKAAREIMERYGGLFPGKYQEIISLPGIGEYTAGAISSICFGEKQVAIDGNVMRVYARVNNVDIDIQDPKTKKQIGEKIKQILPDNPGDFNEGIMELGETICLPNAMPKCDCCPLAHLCVAHQHHREMEVPKMVQKKEKKEEQYTVFLLLCKNQVAIRKRTDGLLKNMWEFPNVSGNISKKNISNYFPVDTKVISIQSGITNTHIFTHKKWKMRSYVIYLENKMDDYVWLSIETIRKEYAIPTAFMPFLKYIEELEK